MAEIMKACISAEFQWREKETILIFINWAMTRPGAASFASPAWLVGLPGRLQRQMVLNGLDGLSGRLRTCLTPAICYGNFQAEPKTQGLAVYTQKLGSGCAPPGVGTRERGWSLLPSPCFPCARHPHSQAGSRLDPTEITFNDIPVVSSPCDLCWNSGL